MIYGVTVWLAKEVFQAVFFPSFAQIMIGRQQLLFDFDRLQTPKNIIFASEAS